MDILYDQYLLNGTTIQQRTVPRVGTKSVRLLLYRFSTYSVCSDSFFSTFFRFPPMSPPFPARRLQLFCGFLRFFAPLPPSPTLFSFPLSSSPFPSPLQSSLTSPFPSPFPSGVRLRTPSPFPPRPRSRPRSRPALLRSLPPPFPLPLHPRPLDRLRSHPRLQSRPRPRSLPPAPRIRLPPRYDALVPTPGLANGAVGCSQAPPPVCRDDDACGMRVPKENRRRRRATSVPSARCWDTLEYVSDLCCTRLMASSLMRACTCVCVCVVVVVVVSHIQRIGCQPETNYFTRWPIPLVVC